MNKQNSAANKLSDIKFSRGNNVDQNVINRISFEDNTYDIFLEVLNVSEWP